MRGPVRGRRAGAEYFGSVTVRSPGGCQPPVRPQNILEPLSVPRLRLGDSTIVVNRDPDPEPRNPETPGRPTHRVSPGVADRRGGGVRTRLRARGPASSAAPRRPHPTSPPLPGLTAPAASCSSAGPCARPPCTSTSSRLRRSLRSWANPLFLF